MASFKLWVRAIRAPFMQSGAIPAIAGGAAAFYDNAFVWWPWLLAVIGSAAINSGTNLINDYYDNRSGDDVVNKQLTPFSGGSRVIQEGLLAPRQIFMAAIIAFSIVGVIALTLALTRSLTVVWFGGAAILLGFFYTAPPLKLGYRGLGEILVGILLGPVTVTATYFVQALGVSNRAIYASIPIGALVAAILFINEFPDYEADKAVNKNHLVVRLGLKRASVGYGVILLITYLSIAGAVIVKGLPWPCLAALLTIPLAVKSYRIARADYSDYTKLMPAQAITIQLHLIIGLLVSLGLVIGKFI